MVKDKWEEHKKKERKRDKKRTKTKIRPSWVDRETYIEFKVVCKKNRRNTGDVLSKLCDLYIKWGDRLFVED